MTDWSSNLKLWETRASGGGQTSISQIEFVMMKEHFDCRLQVFICHHCSVSRWDGSVSGPSILSHLNHKGKRQGTELWLMPGHADWFWLSVRACNSLVMCVCVNALLRMCLQKSLWCTAYCFAVGVKTIQCWQKADERRWYEEQIWQKGTGKMAFLSSICRCLSKPQDTEWLDNAGFLWFVS